MSAEGQANRPATVLGGRRALVGIAVLVALAAAFVAYAVTSAESRGSATSPTFPKSALAVLPAGRPAPAFRLARLGGGAPVSLASFRGKPVIVNFFASWCPDCRQELGAFGAVSRLDGSKVSFVGVDTNDPDPRLAERLLAKAGVRYPVGVDPDGTVASTSYDIAYLPVSYFLTGSGRVVGAAYGAQSRSSLERWVDRLERRSARG